MSRMKKKAQEEMMGFVLIVIIMVVLGMIMLFLFRPKIEERQDLQTKNLLSTLLESTESGKSITSMIESCRYGIACDTTQQAIEARLNSALSNSGLVIGRNLKAYVFTASVDNSAFINISSGSQTGSTIASLVPISDVDAVLKFYY